MKPETMPQDEFDKRLRKARAVLTATPEFAGSEPPMQLLEVVAAGTFLEVTVKAEGATAESAQQLCFALGQACFPLRDPWATAEALLARWRAGRAPTPGAAFGDELLVGDRALLADLPPGGLRIVRVTHNGASAPTDTEGTRKDQ